MTARARLTKAAGEVAGIGVGLGAVCYVLGAACLTLGIILVVDGGDPHHDKSAWAHGIWAGGFNFLFGFIVMLTAQTKNFVLVVIEIVLNIAVICLNFALGVMSITVIATSRETSAFLDAGLLRMAISLFVVNLWNLITITRALCYPQVGADPGYSYDAPSSAPSRFTVPPYADSPSRHILQQAEAAGTYHSYMDRGVAYTTITFRNATINPTLDPTAARGASAHAPGWDAHAHGRETQQEKRGGPVVQDILSLPRPGTKGNNATMHLGDPDQDRDEMDV